MRTERSLERFQLRDGSLQNVMSGIDHVVLCGRKTQAICAVARRTAVRPASTLFCAGEGGLAAMATARVISRIATPRDRVARPRSCFDQRATVLPVKREIPGSMAALFEELRLGSAEACACKPPKRPLAVCPWPEAAGRTLGKPTGCLEHDQPDRLLQQPAAQRLPSPAPFATRRDAPPGSTVTSNRSLDTSIPAYIGSEVFIAPILVTIRSAFDQLFGLTMNHGRGLPQAH